MENKSSNALSRYPDLKANIGIEVHVQLKTASKIFCSCANHFGDEPNTNICPICAGHPGTLPMLNKKVVDYAIKAGLAMQCSITQDTSFARKHYMYPDLPKNYQITQGADPICTEGHLIIGHGDEEKKVRLIRIHMEEDAGKNTHTSKGYSLVDLNRAGTPLLEIVSYPDMHSAEDVRIYLTQLHSIVQYIGISDANMEEGSFRADINISIKKKTDNELGTKVELKNINSFKFIGQAIEYELERQAIALEEGTPIVEETRLWDSKKQISVFMRSKRTDQDYRFLPEPDLAHIAIDQEWIDRIAKEMPELPREKRLRLMKDYNISYDEATILIEDPKRANFFEEASKLSGNAKLTCNWMLRNLLGYMKEHKLTLDTVAVSTQHLADLVKALDSGSINSSAAQEVFNHMASSGDSVADIIKKYDLGQVDDRDHLEAIVNEIIAKSPKQVEQYKSGQERLFMFFVGQAMKATKGKANPATLQSLIKEKLNA